MSELTTGAIVEIAGHAVTSRPLSGRQTHLLPYTYSKPVKALVLGKSQRFTGNLTNDVDDYGEYAPSYYLTGIVAHAVWIVMPIDRHDRYRKPIAVLPEQIVLPEQEKGAS